MPLNHARLEKNIIRQQNVVARRSRQNLRRHALRERNSTQKQIDVFKLVKQSPALKAKQLIQKPVVVSKSARNVGL
jgi:hypothetical protein